MRIRMIAGAAVVGGALATSGVMGLVPAGASVSQGYKCSSIGGVTPSISATVTAKATINKTTKVITLSGVVFKLHNTFGVSATIQNITFVVNDPNTTSAPYVAGSANVAATPAGWTAGHTATGLFENFAGSQSFKALATLTTAALGAQYTDAGPVRTVIKFTTGTVSFDLTSPVQATVTCTPKTPLKVLAQVSE
jgi:hypothetical protein